MFSMAASSTEQCTAAVRVGKRHLQVEAEATRTDDGGIDQLGPAGDADDEDAAFGQCVVDGSEEGRHDPLVRALTGLAGADRGERVELIE